jgi:hypothetical protein
MPSAFSWRPSADHGHPGLHRPDGALPGAGPGRVRGAGAHHPGVLGHVDRGHPLVDPLVLFVVDHLRFHLCHRSHLLCLSRWAEPAGCPGAPVGGNKPGILTGVLEAQCATLRSRPQRSGLWTGSYPKVRRRHEQPALTLPPSPARQHERQPHSGSEPPPAATRTAAIFTPPRPSPGCVGLWGFCGARKSPLSCLPTDTGSRVLQTLVLVITLWVTQRYRSTTKQEGIPCRLCAAVDRIRRRLPTTASA